MLGVNHATVGAACGGLMAGAAMQATVGQRCVMVGLGAFGGLLADSDTKSSHLGKLLPNIWHKLTPGHRGFTHSLLYVGIVAYVAMFIQTKGVDLGWWELPEKPFYPVAVVVGLISHLLADSLTVQGILPLRIPLLDWPRWRFRPLGPLSFTTGTATERLAVIMILSLVGGYVFRPIAKQFIGDLWHTPDIAGYRTEPLLVFGVTVAACMALLVIYTLSITDSSPWGTSLSRRRRKRRGSRSRRRQYA